MKKLLFKIFLFLILLHLVTALDSKLILETTFEHSFENNQEITSKVFLFPLDTYRQRIDSVNFSGISPTINTQSYTYEITNNTYGYTFKSINKLIIPKIKSTSFQKNTFQESNLINSNDPLIKQTTKNIIGNETNYFFAVNKIANWINENINYSLDSLTEDISQNATWVLKNRRGVCDEITILFISMLRSQGIPARYVTGLAYTNYNGLNDFDAHAWAEVYFEEGWIPFDITYEQFGYIDATHIELQKSETALSSSLEYRSKTSVTSNPIKLSSKIIKNFEKINNHIDLHAQLFRSQVKTENYLLLKLKNNNDFYFSEHVFISTPEQITTKKSINIPLKPFEHRTLLIKLTSHLKDIYEVPITINDISNEINLSYKINPNSEDFFLKEFNEETLVSDLFITCDDKCTINNPSLNIKNFDLCVDGNCKKTSSFNKNEQITTINKPLTHIKIQKDNHLIHEDYYFLKEQNKLTLTNLKYPKQTNWGDIINISFTLTTNKPANVNITIKNEKPIDQFNFPNFENTNDFQFQIYSKSLPINITVNNVNYEINPKMELTLLQKLEHFFVKLFNIY